MVRKHSNKHLGWAVCDQENPTHLHPVQGEKTSETLYMRGIKKQILSQAVEIWIQEPQIV